LTFYSWSSKEKNLDIVEYIHSRFPDIKILLYTDRTDFELAKSAVSQGVSAIISPGDDAELIAALSDIKNSLDRQITQKKRDKLFEQLVVSARKQFLTDIFMGNITGRENIQKKAKELSLGNQSCIYCPFWITIPNYNEYMTNRWNYDKERFLIAVGNFLRPENSSFEIHNIMFTNGEIFYVALAETSDATNFINSLRLHLTNTEYNLKTMIGLTVNWHIGRHFMSFHDFIDHITTPILSNSNFSMETTGKKTENHAFLLDMYKNVVISAILDKTPRLKEHLNFIVRLLSQSSENTLADTLAEFCEISMQNMAPHLKENEEFKRMLQSLAKASGATAQSICTNLLVMVCREAGRNNLAASSNTAKRALEYIQNNFTRDLSLEDAAKYLNLNPSYFSRFFKLHTGYNFRDYLIELRVKKAKELLLTGKYKIYEISIMTGYKNSKYFAAQFKAVTGLTPSEFANGEAAKSTGA
ncbi:MAG TPA: hypothetical protein DD391_00040, partial [Clostridiales bacterium]|nr:hypothetical protein [Clostridiales bacterium]